MKEREEKRHQGYESRQVLCGEAEAGPGQQVLLTGCFRSGVAKLCVTKQDKQLCHESDGLHISEEGNKQREISAVEITALEELDHRSAAPPLTNQGGGNCRGWGRLSPEEGPGWDSCGEQPAFFNNRVKI